MDLVEIRKKAKQAKVDAAGEVSEGSPETPDASGVPEGSGTGSASIAADNKETPGSEAETSDPEAVDEDAAPQDDSQPAPVGTGPEQTSGHPAAVPEETDQLAQLFRVGDDLQLASEESYLQAITADEVGIEEQGEQWLTFNLADEEYALPIRHVSEIIKPREVTDLPRVPEFILGIISLRGVIVPVLDLRRRLQFATGDGTSRSRIVVCEHGERIAGLLVDQITQVVQLPESLKEQPPAMLTGVDKELVEGVGRIQGRMIILLDLPTLLEFGSA